MNFVRKHAFKIAVLALCAVMGTYLYLSSTKADKPNLDQNYKAPSFELTDLDGGKVSLENTNGKVRVIYFFYSNCPDVCPPTTYLMTEAQDELKKKGVFGSEVEFLSITFDPERDTTEAIRKFAGKFNVDAAGWKFLREDSEEDTKQLMKGFGLGLVKDANGYFTHSDAITFVDRTGNVRKAIAGSITETQADEIVKIVNALVKE
ncbi:SCO family protein [Paenibacillus nasutitermitis]|uniref:Cytochrome-c oxidase n=1 Tax=Paenibacillus nasutitermitis TaxID=1652958 RepID=A0A917DWW5_9BACL|nr:SCO family protein [Paenibacillus nasutitermitis]GGD75374.1 cytochrome-c oxidase [Paenibacillus nasutitermitis]